MAESSNSLAHSLVLLNNGALAFFLEGRLTDSIELLSHAYILFDSHRRKQHQLQEAGRFSFGGYQPILAVLNPEQSSSMSSYMLFKDGIHHASSSSAHQMPQSTSYHTRVNSSGVLQHAKMRSIAVQRRDVNDNCAKPSMLNSGESTTHSLYNRGLLLSTHSLNEDAAAIFGRHQHRTSAILLYNMALCYHNLGSHFGVSSALPKALQLYELALESIDQGSDVKEVQKLLMAILNNCANIYMYFRRFEETQRCFDNLKVVLAASTLDMAMDDDYNFFFLNALFQTKELFFAPAA